MHANGISTTFKRSANVVEEGAHPHTLLEPLRYRFHPIIPTRPALTPIPAPTTTSLA